MVIEELRKDGIASLTGEGDITGFQRAAHTLSGNRRRISGVVHPPCAIIIVQVVIRFMRTDPNRGANIFMSCHEYAWFEVHAPAWVQKKIDSAGTILRAGECLGSVASGRTSLDHRGDSPVLGNNPVGVIPQLRNTS
jgi:hypothetical protein